MRLLSALLVLASMLLLTALPVAGQSEYEAEIEAACAYHGCDAAYVIAIMYCESGGDPNAVSAEVNKETGTHDLGLFQINYVYWGEKGPIEQIWWAAEMIANGYASYWECAALV
jgi:hypothetical protein